jgi:glycerophosphoryl diester phosphodiesterase
MPIEGGGNSPVIDPLNTYIFPVGICAVMLIIGHRGARALGPENTLRAIGMGMKCAESVEVDIRRSRDGVPVIIHDSTLERTTSGAGPVADLTLPQLRTLNAGRGERIPTLQDVLSLTSWGKVGLILELKEPENVERICALIAESGVNEVLIASSLIEPLRRAKALLPEVPIGLIFSAETRDPIGLAREMGAEVLLPAISQLSRELVIGAHQYQMKVFCWTANTEQEVRKAVSDGADGIISDDPCATRAILRVLDIRLLIPS